MQVHFWGTLINSDLLKPFFVLNSSNSVRISTIRFRSEFSKGGGTFENLNNKGMLSIEMATINLH